MRIDEMQQLQLWHQSLAKIWRFQAFKSLLGSKDCPSSNANMMKKHTPSLTSRFHGAITGDERIVEVLENNSLPTEIDEAAEADGNLFSPLITSSLLL